MANEAIDYPMVQVRSLTVSGKAVAITRSHPKFFYRHKK